MFVGQRLVSIFVANVLIWNEALASFDASNLTLTRFSSPPYDPDSKIHALDIVLYSGPFCLITNGHRIAKNILCISLVIVVTLVGTIIKILPMYSLRYTLDRVIK